MAGPLMRAVRQPRVRCESLRWLHEPGLRAIVSLRPGSCQADEQRTGGDVMTKGELRLRLAYASHAVVPSLTPGYVVCHCGCGYVGVCRHCVPHAPAHLPSHWCETAQAMGQAGRPCGEEGQGYVRAT